MKTKTPNTQLPTPPTPRTAAATPVDPTELRRSFTPRARGASGQHVRLHVEAGDVPRLRQLAGMSTWAAVLTFGGLIVAIRAAVGIIAGEAPSWYQSAIVIVGLVGIALAAAAFVFAQLPRLVWIALSLSTAVLLAATILTAQAL